MSVIIAKHNCNGTSIFFSSSALHVHLSLTIHLLHATFSHWNHAPNTHFTHLQLHYHTFLFQPFSKHYLFLTFLFFLFVSRSPCN
ncbi:hypothetical protein DFJ73DRAFT_826468, partial [Zopfochytrium polystomum]